MSEGLEYLPIYIAQILLDVIIASILLSFHRSYNRAYLLHWSLSWWALAAYHVTSGFTYWLAFRRPPDSVVLTALTVAYMSFGVLQVSWLLQGTRELLVGGELPRRLMLAVQLGLIALAAILVFASMSSTIDGMFFFRFGLLSLGTGLAFIAAGLAILAAKKRDAHLGRRIVSSSLLSYGILRLPYFVTTLAAHFEVAEPLLAIILQSIPALDLLDFLVQATTGLGMVIWLLETEHYMLLEAQERIRQSQRLEALGRLVGGIAHDFNNLLTVIVGHSELLIVRLRGNTRVLTDAEQILRAAERASLLTNQLLGFGRKQARQPHVLDLNRVVAEMSGMLSRLMPENVQIESRLTDNLVHVKCDPSQLEQVVMNLALNARDAMPDGGMLTIETRNHRAEDGSPIPEAHFEARPHAVISVSDTGVGMDADTRRHIFEPFFTTKKLGEGTGLGLATLYGIVKQNDGFVTVTSAPGAGTCFDVFLPAVAQDIDQSSPESSAPAEETWPRILIVEDDAAVRDYLTEALRNRGYEVTPADSAECALEVLASLADGPDIVISDVVMPGMSGIELANEVVAVRPELPVLLMSGYAQRAQPQSGGWSFIQKPFTSEQLVQRIRETIGSRSPTASA